MVWYGMAWNGVVWNGLALFFLPTTLPSIYGMAWHSVVWDGMALPFLPTLLPSFRDWAAVFTNGSGWLGMVPLTFHPSTSPSYTSSITQRQ